MPEPRISPIRIITPASGESELSPERDHVVGRGRDCDVVISDGRVSRHHLRLEPTVDGWLARDISSGGIWVNGDRASVVPLAGGEVRVRLGAADGPQLVLIPPPPPPPDVSTEETVLAGQGGLPRTAPSRPTPTARPVPPGPPGQGVPVGQRIPAGQAVPAGQAAPAGQGAPAAGSGQPTAQAAFLRALPTFVWLAAIGFFLGALLALS